MSNKTLTAGSGILLSIGASDVTVSSAVSSVTVPLTANQVNHLFSAPQTIVAAPGMGKAIILVSIELALRVGTIIFDSQNGTGNVYYGSASGLILGLQIDNISASRVFQAALTGGPQLFTDITNAPVVAAGAGEDLVNGGAIATATVNAGGLGYAPGDTGTVNPQTTATYVVDTVSAGGVVTTFHFSDPGYGNNLATGAATNVSTGAGDGNFKMNITSITPGNGAASITAVYYTLALP